MLLRRYGNLEYILQMEVGEFFQFLLKAREEERKEQIRNQWTAMLPLMSIKYLKYIPFEEYYEKCTGVNIDLRTNEEIIADIEETHRLAHKEKVGE